MNELEMSGQLFASGRVLFFSVRRVDPKPGSGRPPLFHVDVTRTPGGTRLDETAKPLPACDVYKWLRNHIN